MTLADRVLEARRARNWTREHLAVYSGVSSSTIGRIERGGHAPRASALIALARVLEIPLDELAAEAGITIHPQDPDDQFWSQRPPRLPLEPPPSASRETR